jgi:hypothetical protein
MKPPRLRSSAPRHQAGLVEVRDRNGQEDLKNTCIFPCESNATFMSTCRLGGPKLPINLYAD